MGAGAGTETDPHTLTTPLLLQGTLEPGSDPPLRPLPYQRNLACTLTAWLWPAPPTRPSVELGPWYPGARGSSWAGGTQSQLWMFGVLSVVRGQALRDSGTDFPTRPPASAGKLGWTRLWQLRDSAARLGPESGFLHPGLC